MSSSIEADLDDAVYLQHVCNECSVTYNMDRTLVQHSNGDYFVQVDPMCPECGDKEIDEGRFIPCIMFDQEFIEGDDDEDGSEGDDNRDYRGP